MPVKKIASSEVDIGMFISSLDRPWTETPFLFQGFMVRTQEELDDLRRLTKHVYVAIPDEEIELHELPKCPVALPTFQKTYATAPFEKEVEKVRDSHEDIANLVSEVTSLATSDSPLRLADLDHATQVMADSITSNPDAYVWLTSIRKFDSYIYKDALASAVWATALGRVLGLEAARLQALSTGVLLMDIGKTSLPHELLHKTTRLTNEEWELMKSHVEKGLRLLEYNGEDNLDVLDIVRTHHERIDGSGYPEGLTGNHIPLFGKIAGIVDFYVAVTNRRPFAKPISPSKALQMLYTQKDKYFDADLVEAFIQLLGAYPTGSLVELSSGEVAIVCSQDPRLHLKPTVVLLLDPEKKPYNSYPIVSLTSYRHGPRETPVSIAKSLPDGSYGLDIDNLSL